MYIYTYTFKSLYYLLPHVRCSRRHVFILYPAIYLFLFFRTWSVLYQGSYLQPWGRFIPTCRVHNENRHRSRRIFMTICYMSDHLENGRSFGAPEFSLFSSSPRVRRQDKSTGGPPIHIYIYLRV